MLRAQAHRLIMKERHRQIEMEGFNINHDNQWRDGELTRAASAYMHAAMNPGDTTMPQYWPWDKKWWKPKDALRNLTRAGALLVAEQERKARNSDFDVQLVNFKLSQVLTAMEKIDE